MGNVILDMAVSLDGFIATRDGGDGGIMNWYFSPAPPSAKVIDELIDTIGSLVMGKRTYDQGAEANGFADDPYAADRFVLTYHPMGDVRQGEKVFRFVNDGIESALEKARAAAGDKDVCIGGGADVAQQYLRAGLVDVIQLHIVPVILGEGIRLFDHLGGQPIPLEITRVVESVGVTHVRYRVVR